MQAKLDQYTAEINQFSPATAEEVESFRIKFLGSKGIVKELFDEFKSVGPEEKRVFGEVLNEFKQVDFILFDGNHRLEPTMQYFEQSLPFINENTVFIFDDIYWSNEMKQAWQQIKGNSQVSVTIDLFDMGLVFFRKGQKKQDFLLRV